MIRRKNRGKESQARAGEREGRPIAHPSSAQHGLMGCTTAASASVCCLCLLPTGKALVFAAFHGIALPRCPGSTPHLLAQGCWSAPLPGRPAAAWAACSCWGRALPLPRRTWLARIGGGSGCLPLPRHPGTWGGGAIGRAVRLVSLWTKDGCWESRRLKTNLVASSTTRPFLLAPIWPHTSCPALSLHQCCRTY